MRTCVELRKRGCAARVGAVFVAAATMVSAAARAELAAPGVQPTKAWDTFYGGVQGGYA